jgi:hypothetical protein
MPIDGFGDCFVIDDVRSTDRIIESGDLAIGNPAFESPNPRIVNRQTVAQSTIGQSAMPLLW